MSRASAQLLVKDAGVTAPSPRQVSGSRRRPKVIEAAKFGVPENLDRTSTSSMHRVVIFELGTLSDESQLAVSWAPMEIKDRTRTVTHAVRPAATAQERAAARASRAGESLAMRVRRWNTELDERACTFQIFSAFNRLLSESNAAACDHALSSLTGDPLKATVSLAILSITLRAKSELVHRARFLEATQAALRSERTTVEADALLAGLV
ncbi:MAG TPA: hypothetical protein VEL07_16400 [Planctomycetota bacterium]|nr:hypothetical protein [Planctomycetota bacterium]